MAEPSLPLFREEALDQQRNRWLGAVIFDQRLSPVMVMMAILFILVLAFVLVGSSQYTRKARLSGWLVPDTGLVRIQAPFAGRVSDILVREGQYVEAGDDLLILSADQTGRDGRQIGEAVLETLRQRQQSLEEDRALRLQLNQQQAQSLTARLSSFQQQKSAIDAELTIAQQQIVLNNEFMANQRNLYEQNLITQEQYLAAREANLERAAQAERLKQSAANLQIQLDDTRAQLRELPLTLQVELAEIERSRAGLQQQLAEISAQSAVIVKAPVNGRVSSLQVSNSTNVPVNVPIITILPEGSVLQAHFYGPSRTVGFINAGQQAALRYDAFPFQRHGVFRGQVISVSGSAISPAELPTELSQFATQQTQADPLYRIVVALDQQTVMSGSRLIALQAGMQLQADIALEKRSVFQWFLEPILRLGQAR